MLVSELVTSTDQVFQDLISKNSAQKLKDDEFQMRAQAYMDANLSSHLRILSYDYRVDKAKNLGLIAHPLDKFVSILMGNPPTRISTSWGHFTYEYVYDFVKNTELDRSDLWVPNLTFLRGHWWSKDHYVVQNRPMGQLLRPIPYGVVLRLQEIKELKLFNAFSVLAPREAFATQQFAHDPIVIGEMWRNETPQRNEYDSLYDSTQQTYFFIAKWGD